MKSLEDFINESMLYEKHDKNIDNASLISDEDKIIDFLNRHYLFDECPIKDKLDYIEIKKEGNKNVVNVKQGQLILRRSKNLALVPAGGLFTFGEVKDFIIEDCKNLKTLKGAPQKCDFFVIDTCPMLEDLTYAPKQIHEFHVENCENLTSLAGFPNVCDILILSELPSLKSLEGLPKNIGKDLWIDTCESLTNFVGAPKTIGGDFRCTWCDNLVSLEGVPQEIGGDFCVARCSRDFKEYDYVPNSVGGKFIKDEKVSDKNIDRSKFEVIDYAKKFYEFWKKSLY